MMKNIRWRVVLPFLFYLIALIFVLITGTAEYLTDERYRADGTMGENVLSNANFTFINILEAGDDKLACLTSDPQLEWTNHRGLRVRRVVMTAEFSQDPGEVGLFYRFAGQDEFTRDQYVYAVRGSDGTYTFTLPRTDVEGLRLDLCSTVCVVRNLRVTFNPPQTFWSYFELSRWELFQLFLYPGLAACLADFIYQIIRRRHFAAAQHAKPVTGGNL